MTEGEEIAFKDQQLIHVFRRNMTIIPEGVESLCGKRGFPGIVIPDAKHCIPCKTLNKQRQKEIITK